jgi:hypothetical protein
MKSDAALYGCVVLEAVVWFTAVIGDCALLAVLDDALLACVSGACWVGCGCCVAWVRWCIGAGDDLGMLVAKVRRAFFMARLLLASFIFFRRFRDEVIV